MPNRITMRFKLPLSSLVDTDMYRHSNHYMHTLPFPSLISTPCSSAHRWLLRLGAKAFHDFSDRNASIANMSYACILMTKHRSHDTTGCNTSCFPPEPGLPSSLLDVQPHASGNAVGRDGNIVRLLDQPTRSKPPSIRSCPRPLRVP